MGQHAPLAAGGSLRTGELKTMAVDSETEIELDAMMQNATTAAQFLRCIANPHRLMVLCHLTHGEASVGQLERELGIRQAHLSQQLARLRQDGLVTTRRDSRTIYYALGSDAARDLVGLIYRLFCTAGVDKAGGCD
ncbi:MULTISPECIES: metalloregulator ArsR/SmtB family transcription factor [unclassified Acidiphilium]|uniref:ArsR/SmtB family transcription factor n=1 Tax=unclassified Acidiphilium TaxID=2617493 RepID=UPI000BD72F3F|nr:MULTISPECIES: metalloregulator ArsR/SmtB family transcription factor [unclassified Acidiphilium]OYV57545.1 MAG: transcriptional regulator [Acidiphilium sp. 20-67-58]HQT59576.1 metalloregulator ArsR/SmtB family transcription factor [Acidiphilium sp.]